MKLSIQTIKSVIKEVDVTPDTTIDQLREQIRLLYNWPEGSRIVLVHKTKILNQTSSKLSEVPSIKDGDRIVVMKKTEPVHPTPAPPVVPQVAVDSAPVADTSAPTGGGTSPPQATANTSQAVPDTSMFYSDAQIVQLGGMGFDAASARRALTAAFGNTDRAVEYLISGNIPTVTDDASNRPSEVTAQAPTQFVAPEQQPHSTPSIPLANNTNGLQTEAFGRVEGQPTAGSSDQALPANAVLSQFGQLAAADPSFLPQMLRALGEQNPALLGLIEQNPRMFTQLLTSVAAGEHSDGGADQPQIPQTVAIHLSPPEVEAVNRLCELGFSRESALQAYLACDKNEELAANFLFDNDDINE